MKFIGLIVISMFCLGFFLVAPEHAQADTFYYYQTWAPTAEESNSWKVYPRYSTTPVSCYAAQGFYDGYTVNLASSTGNYYYIETGDFTNPTWLGPWSIPVGGIEPYALGQTGEMPGENSTITSVIVLAKFNSQYPQTTLYFSTNDKSSWATSSIYPAGGGGILPFYAITWNVTALAAWNYTMLSSPDLWVKAKFAPVTGVNYYLDYLGFIVCWYDVTEWIDGGSEDPLPDPSEEGGDGVDLDYDLIYSGDGIVGVMGFVGLIGMIAVPALGVFVYRANQGEGKIAIFIKMLVLFMFCLTCFMVSVSGA